MKDELSLRLQVKSDQGRSHVAAVSPAPQRVSQGRLNRLAKAAKVDSEMIVGPASDLHLLERRLAGFGMHDIHPQNRLPSPHRLGRPGPDIAPCHDPRQPHDFSPPGLACVLGILAPLLQELVHHFVQRGIIVGNEGAVVFRNVQSDGSSVAVRALPDLPAKGQGARNHDRNGPQDAVEVAGIEFAPAIGHGDAERAPRLASERAHIFNGKELLMIKIRACEQCCP